uniref:Uncharacterized protein n=1 Tax=Anguilla anguilla TaxID=7936 RepID=A0A0E9X1F9_ANGAN
MQGSDLADDCPKRFPLPAWPHRQSCCDMELSRRKRPIFHSSLMHHGILPINIQLELYTEKAVGKGSHADV